MLANIRGSTELVVVCVQQMEIQFDFVIIGRRFLCHTNIQFMGELPANMSCDTVREVVKLNAMKSWMNIPDRGHMLENRVEYFNAIFDLKNCCKISYMNLHWAKVS